MQIIDEIHDNNGRFVKRQGRGGPWIEVDEVFAKEKITQSLRDGLSSKYRSATKAKRQRRAHHDKIMNEDIEHIIRSNKNVAQQVDTFYDQVNEMNSSGESLPSDEEMMALFTQANSNILETMKKDPKLHQQFQAVADVAETESNNIDTCDDTDTKITCQVNENQKSCSEMETEAAMTTTLAAECKPLEPFTLIDNNDGRTRLRSLSIDFPSRFSSQLDQIVFHPLNIIEDENIMMWIEDENRCDEPCLLNVISS
jgi:hypothetical protein